jgi:hypothetical protein
MNEDGTINAELAAADAKPLSPVNLKGKLAAFAEEDEEDEEDEDDEDNDDDDDAPPSIHDVAAGSGGARGGRGGRGGGGGGSAAAAGAMYAKEAANLAADAALLADKMPSKKAGGVGSAGGAEAEWAAVDELRGATGGSQTTAGGGSGVGRSMGRDPAGLETSITFTSALQHFKSASYCQAYASDQGAFDVSYEHERELGVERQRIHAIGGGGMEQPLEPGAQVRVHSGEGGRLKEGTVSAVRRIVPTEQGSGGGGIFKLLGWVVWWVGGG